MKYIDSEKLIAEIERLRNLCAKSIGDGFIDGDLPKTMTSGGAAWVCEQLLSFITSLQQERPEVDIDIKQELYHHFGQVKDFTLGVSIASFFYELGLNARKEE